MTVVLSTSILDSEVANHPFGKVEARDVKIAMV